MPRLYNPELRWEEYRDEKVAYMEESKFGRWVKLSTFKDTTAQLHAEIERLKKKLHGTD